MTTRDMMPGPHPLPRKRLSARLALGVVVASAVLGHPTPAQESDTLPFRIGEHLEYRVKVSRLKASGRSSMSVEGPVDVRGTRTYLLRFDFEAGLGPFKATDRTESWLDPRRMAVLRFHKSERHPLSSGKQEIELFPAEQRWEGKAGAAGDSPTHLPLDELSFIYFIRTLPLNSDTTYTFDRHFQQDRNPITVRVLGRDTVATGLGDLATIHVEMRVRDPARYRESEGVIRIHFTDDHRRLPARIESEMPVVGRAIMTLEVVTDRHIASGKP